MGALIVPTGGAGDTAFTATDHCKVRAEACLEACGGRRRTAIDGGAYVGTFAQHLVGQFSRVIAFEPIDRNADCLRQNVPAARAVQAALSDQDGFGYMRPLDPPKSYSWGVAPGGPGLHPCNYVAMVTLDSLGIEDLDLLKLDVEGHEFEALRGAEKTLKVCRPVVMIEEKLDRKRRATRFLEQLGMKCILRIKRDYLFIWG